jgi:hypothetical protein
MMIETFVAAVLMYHHHHHEIFICNVSLEEISLNVKTYPQETENQKLT